MLRTHTPHVRLVNVSVRLSTSREWYMNVTVRLMYVSVRPGMSQYVSCTSHECLCTSLVNVSVRLSML
jgi:hypothetical protein